METEEALIEERPRVFRFDPGPIGIRLDPLLRVHGYKSPEHVRPDVRAIAQACVERAKALLDPSLHYLRVGVETCSGDTLRLQTGTMLRCKAFERYLGNPRFVVIAILTLGSRIDKQVDAWLREEDVLEAMFLETAAWLALETMTTKFASYLRYTVGAEGYRLSPRMSPGYSYQLKSGPCEWSLDQQKALFDVFGHGELPVKLMDSCAMVPKMSRTGLYALRVASDIELRDGGSADLTGSQ